MGQLGIFKISFNTFWSETDFVKVHMTQFGAIPDIPRSMFDKWRREVKFEALIIN